MKFYSACTGPLEQSPSPSTYLPCFYRHPNDLRYASLSFPSLHAAFSSFSCTFVSVSLFIFGTKPEKLKIPKLFPLSEYI